MRNKIGIGIKGFTLLELMIVLLIVAILVAMAYPSYVDYVRKARRGEAQELLMNWSINQEIWRSNHSTYADDAVGQLVAPTNDYYNFSLAAPDPPTATTYVLQAVAPADSGQLNDVAKDGTNCGTLNMNSAGQKYSGGDPTKQSCWD
jgi:type IV pilus assembly protein PilE